MSQVAKQREAQRRSMVGLYQPVEQEMQHVEQLLRQELTNRHAGLDELIQYGFRIGGKRLRPALLLLAGKCAGKLCHDHVVLAAVVEMIHTATLIHDDILDEADLRRHRDTVNARYSNESSVLLGDYLFTHAFYLASTLGSTFGCRTIGRATNMVCEGELRQVGNVGNFELAENEYLEIIDAKTAALTACCCRLGAHYAGADELVEERLAAFGRHLGIAFQIVDDLLDVVGDESLAGKSLGTDLDQHKPTLPLIRLLDLVSGGERHELVLLLRREGNHSRQALLPWLERYETLNYAREKARQYATQARESLIELPPSPALDVLLGLTEFVILRDI